MSAAADTAGTRRSTLTADLNRGGPPPLGAPVTALSPLAIALERWMNEGGSGNDPDDTARPDQAQKLQRRKNQ